MLKQADKIEENVHKRICMLTTRNILHNAFRCGSFEAQDVLAKIDDVDFIELAPKSGCKTRQKFQNYLISKDFSKKIVNMNFAYHYFYLKYEYDLFVAYLPIWTDLIQIPAVKNLKDKCKTSVCWIDEFWISGIRKLGAYLSALDNFDYIMVGFKSTAEALSKALQRTVYWVPNAVDVFRFSPLLQNPKRVIDIYSIGRIWPGMHNALATYSDKNNLFYIYDTFHAADTRIKDHRKHRTMIANMIKRCRFFTVSPAKMDVEYQIQEQSEVGARYFEGAAAGAVLIGQKPSSGSFNILFGWQDSVIELKQDGSDISDVFGQLLSNEKALRSISNKNSSESALRHDWVYRWDKIYKIINLEPSIKLQKRKNSLRKLAGKSLD